MSDASGYAYLWAFTVQPEAQQQFEAHYGPEGSWAKLFSRSPGYIGTLLLQDRNDPLRYVTVDRWRSLEEYETFRSACAEDYAALDRRCEALTVREEPLGEYRGA